MYGRETDPDYRFNFV